MKQRNMWIGLGISLVLLLLLFFRIDYAAFWAAVTSASWPSGQIFRPRIDFGRLWMALGSADRTCLVLGGFLLLGNLAIRAWRWGYLLRPLKAIGFSSLFSATSIGMMANNLFPARLGELVRAFILGQREHLDTSASFATIVVERVLDLFSILFIMTLLLSTIPLPIEAGLARALRWGGVVGFILVTLGLYLFVRYLHRSTAQAMRGIRRVCSLLPQRWATALYGVLESFSTGLQTVGQGESLGQLIVGSAALWSTIGLYNFFVVLAFELQLPLAVGFFLLVFQAFAVSVPSSPGFVGPYHAASVLCLSLWGVQTEAALGVVLVMHALGYLITIAAGLCCLWAVGLSPRDLTRAKIAIQRQPSA